MGRFAPAWSLVFLLSGAASAQTVKLNLALPHGASPTAQEVLDFALSPDGAWAVFRAFPDAAENTYAGLFSAPLDGSAPPRTLEPVPQAGSAGVMSFAVSPDGTWVACIGSGRQLERIPIDGSSPPQALSGNIQAPPAAQLAIVGAAGRIVLYADLDGPTLGGLYSVLDDGSGPLVPLHPALGAGRRILSVNGRHFQVTPDGSRVLFVANLDLPDAYELFSVPIDGSAAPVKLHPAFVALRLVQAYEIAPDGSRVTYVADQEVDDKYELYSVPVDGSAPAVKLSGTIVGNVALRGISPDSSTVVYRAKPVFIGGLDLFSVPLDGSAAPLQLNDTVAGDVEDARIAPDGSRVVYRADRVTGVFELFSVPIDDSAPPTRLNGTLVPGGDVGVASSSPHTGLGSSFRISLDGTRVVYAADQDTDGKLELFGVPIAGGTAVKLSGDLVAGGSVHDEFFELSPDGRLVFVADKAVDERFEIWSTPLDGSAAPVRVNANLAGEGDVQLPVQLPTEGNPAFLVGPGSRLVYAADQAVNDVIELWSAPIDGAQTSLSLMEEDSIGPVVGDVGSFRWAGRDGRVLYTADQEVDGRYALYSTSLRVDAFELSDPEEGANEILAVVDRPEPASPWVVYAHGATARSVPLDGSAPPVQVGRSPGLQVSSDGSMLVYPDDLNCPLCMFPNRLFSGPVDGSSAPQEIGGVLFGQSMLRNPRITSDGSRVVFSGGVNQEELWSVPIGGETAPVRISMPLPTSGQILPSFRLSPDGSRAVYVERHHPFPVDYELFSVPTDGSSFPERLNAPFGPNQDVDAFFAISPDGARVVYRVDQEVDGVFELWSAPIEGNSPRVRRVSGAVRAHGPVRLSAPMVAGGDVAQESFGIPSFAVDPQGTRVVYRADQDTDEVYELYSVPIDGASAPVKLNGFLGATGDVPRLFYISPDGTRVLYVADQDTDEVFELYSVPIDGGAPPVRISGAMVAGGDVVVLTGGPQAIQLDPTGRFLLYAADQTTDEVFELFLAPIDGSADPEQVSDPMVAGGDAFSFAFGPGGRSVAYLADQDTDGVIELYAWSLPPRSAPSLPPTGTVTRPAW